MISPKIIKSSRNLIVYMPFYTGFAPLPACRPLERNGSTRRLGDHVAYRPLALAARGPHFQCLPLHTPSTVEPDIVALQYVCMQQGFRVETFVVGLLRVRKSTAFKT
jgi:hypothetical protein